MRIDRRLSLRRSGASLHPVLLPVLLLMLAAAPRAMPGGSVQHVPAGGSSRASPTRSPSRQDPQPRSFPAAGRLLQEATAAACECESCVQNVGGGYCKGDECTIHHCVGLGLVCSCYVPCPCATCVRKGGEQPYCESIWGDCSCLIDGDGDGDGAQGGKGGAPAADACADLSSRTEAVNDECCNEPTEDCSSGRPSTCNPGCAHVLLPFFSDCSDALGAAGAASFDDVVRLCRAATCPVGGFLSGDTHKCTACPVGFFKAEVGVQECTECLAGTTTVATGSTLPSQCVPPPPPPPEPTAAVTCAPIIGMFTYDDHIVVLQPGHTAVAAGGTCMVGCDIANGYAAASRLPGTKFTCGADGAWIGSLTCTKDGGGH